MGSTQAASHFRWDKNGTQEAKRYGKTNEVGTAIPK